MKVRIYPETFGRSNPSFIFIQCSIEIWGMEEVYLVRGTRVSVNDYSQIRKLSNSPSTVAIWRVKYFGNAKMHNK